jgi:hypothetical protein
LRITAVAGLAAPDLVVLMFESLSLYITLPYPTRMLGVASSAAAASPAVPCLMSDAGDRDGGAAFLPASEPSGVPSSSAFASFALHCLYLRVPRCRSQARSSAVINLTVGSTSASLSGFRAGG